MLSIVIPSYNRKDCILRLLENIYAQRGIDFEVIVVDDCSPDDTAKLVRERFPQVTLLVNEVNGGPCVSRNRGVRAARGHVVVGFDSDVEISDRGLLAKVAATLGEFPDVAGLAFRILKPDGVTDDVERWWHPVPIEHFAGQRFMTSYFSGTGYAFRRQCMLDGGLYREALYMHYEEVELAWRILDNGGAILHCPELKVLHHEGKAPGRNKVQLYYKPRNQILLALSCFPLWRAAIYLLPRVVFQFVKAVRHRHVNDFASAMRDGIQVGRREFWSRMPLRSNTLARLRRLRDGEVV